LYEIARSTTVVIIVWYTSIQEFGVIGAQTGTQQTNLCRPRSAPQRRARAPRPSAFALVHRPRPTTVPDRAAPEAARAPDAQESASVPRAGVPRAPCRSDAHPLDWRSVCDPRPCASYYGRDITSSPPLVEPPLFKCPPLLLTPPDPAPATPPLPWPPPGKPSPCSPLGHRARE
jgi:hypothetical protein